MHPSAYMIVNKPCKQPRSLCPLVCLLVGAPAIGEMLSSRIDNRHRTTSFCSGRRALPFAAEGRYQNASTRSPFTPLLKIQTNAPIRAGLYGSFLDKFLLGRDCALVSADIEKEKSRGKIESVLLLEEADHE